MHINGQTLIVAAKSLCTNDDDDDDADQRNVPALGRIGDPDDIIGTVLVENSKVLTPCHYQ